MKKENISDAVIRRLPRYYRQLTELCGRGVVRISSHSLGQEMNITACLLYTSQKITSGEIFLTRSGKGMSRRQIWAEMKSLCERAGVEPSKVFPHNLRHVFAAAFYKSCKDIVRLADVLGHSSVETTRIYLLTTGVEHAQMLERLGLVL